MLCHFQRVLSGFREIWDELEIVMADLTVIYIIKLPGSHYHRYPDEWRVSLYLKQKTCHFCSALPQGLPQTTWNYFCEPERSIWQKPPVVLRGFLTNRPVWTWHFSSVCSNSVLVCFHIAVCEWWAVKYILLHGWSDKSGNLADQRRSFWLEFFLPEHSEVIKCFESSFTLCVSLQDRSHQKTRLWMRMMFTEAWKSWQSKYTTTQSSQCITAYHLKVNV